jgi:RNA-directed DNA polymerase
MTMKARTGTAGLNRHGSKQTDQGRPAEACGVSVDGKHAGPECDLMAAILAPATLNAAWRRVKANAGAAGIDGMSVAAFPEFIRQHWPRIAGQIKQGNYQPAPVRRVWLAKPDGGRRPLGIPTVLDRVIQQSIALTIGPLFEEHFHENSYGYRPGRSAHDAIHEIQSAAQGGRVHAVDCDLKGFFDTVDHRQLMLRLRRRIADGRVLRLIERYLCAGVVLPDGQREPTPCGVPQGGPLSPLLANIMLDDLDHELARRGHRFARYADDFLVVVKSERAARRVLGSVSRYVETKLKLVINTTKTRVARLSRCRFLGFAIGAKRLRVSEDNTAAFLKRIRALTGRSRGIAMSERLGQLHRYVTGWLNYFAPGAAYKDIVAWDRWLRRRVRLCYWKQWQRPRTRRRNLLRLGADPEEVHMATRSRKGYWRMSSNSIVQAALSNAWLEQQGVPSLTRHWVRLRYPDDIASAG